MHEAAKENAHKLALSAAMDSAREWKSRALAAEERVRALEAEKEELEKDVFYTITEHDGDEERIDEMLSLARRERLEDWPVGWEKAFAARRGEK